MIDLGDLTTHSIARNPHNTPDTSLVVNSKNDELHCPKMKEFG
jgi:hypothetical protein